MSKYTSTSSEESAERATSVHNWRLALQLGEVIALAVLLIAVVEVIWSYLGYPVFLALCSFLVSRKRKVEEWEPEVSVIITAHNEEKRIAKKIENTLALDYPRDKLSVIVVSDASTDRTEEIVRSYVHDGVTLRIIPEHRGKHYGQGRGVDSAPSEIVVLTDATTFLEPDAVRMIVQNYADPKIGCVSGCDLIETEGDSSAGEGAYVRYEMSLRNLESKVSSIIGASGSFFSVRKSLCDGWIDDMSSDFYLPIKCYMKGYCSVIDNRAIGRYTVLHETSREFQRKLRTVVHGLEVLFHFKEILNPFRYGLFSVQIISHKLCRWLVPFAMIIALVSNFFLLPFGVIYQLVFASQILFYILALLAQLIHPLQSLTLFKIPLFFVMVNASILVAWYKFLMGVKYVVWKATER